MKNNRKNRKRLAIGFKKDMALYPFDKRVKHRLTKIVKGFVRQPLYHGFEAKYYSLLMPGTLKLMGWEIKNDMLQPIRLPRMGVKFPDLFKCIDKATAAFESLGATARILLDKGAFGLKPDFGIDIYRHLKP